MVTVFYIPHPGCMKLYGILIISVKELKKDLKHRLRNLRKWASINFGFISPQRSLTKCTKDAVKIYT